MLHLILYMQIQWPTLLAKGSLFLGKAHFDYKIRACQPQIMSYRVERIRDYSELLINMGGAAFPDIDIMQIISDYR